MALKIVKGSIDRMFDKNLQDLVRGIRNHKEDEVKLLTVFSLMSDFTLSVSKHSCNASHCKIAS